MEKNKHLILKEKGIKELVNYGYKKNEIFTEYKININKVLTHTGFWLIKNQYELFTSSQ